VCLEISRKVSTKNPALTDPEILSRLLAPIGNDFVAHLGTLIEAAQSRFLNSRNVHEDVFAAVVWLDKSVTLGRVEPFHYTCRHVRFSNLKTTAVS
jgi:hypothetical protein